MTERLRYGIDEYYNLTLDVPDTVFNAAMDGTKLEQVLEQPQKFVRIDEDADGKRLLFERKVLETFTCKNTADAEPIASYWVYALHAIKANIAEHQQDEAISVDMSLSPLPDASGMDRRGMHADVRWPLDDNHTASTSATTAMRQIALSFGYVQPSFVRYDVFGLANQSGLEFQALQIGCSCLTTQGEEFRHTKDSGSIELTGHNLYNRQLQLTCLYGLVAATRAR